MQTHNAIENIVIIGGGTAGWMTAASLSNVINHSCKITLIESTNIGTVGVGEASIPPIKTFNKSLGIDETTFLKETNATFKLGIEFINWGKLNSSYFHPFGDFGRPFDIVNLHNYWINLNQQGKVDKFDEYCMAWALAKRGKFSHPILDKRNVRSTYDYAYHFDASLYIKLLKNYATNKGVTHIDGTVADNSQNSATGHIKSVTLNNGNIVEGDLFIDCSGFKGVLIEEVLKTGYHDWSHWLPCDNAWAVASPPKYNKPYTRSIAHKAGWQWQIPLQSRVGNGHVFSSSYISEGSALDSLLSEIGSNTINEPRLLKFKTGMRKKQWNKNVIAIGLSSGFLEPLESTSIHLIQSSIAKLLALFPTKKFEQSVIDEYNKIATSEITAIRDFLILHYHLNQRDDSDMWRDLRAMDIPESLHNKIQQFKSYGRVIRDNIDLFGNASWLAVHIGQGNLPIGNDPLLNYRDINSCEWLSKLKSAFEYAAEQMPPHDQYLSNLIHNS